MHRHKATVAIMLGIGLLTACGSPPPLKTGNWQGTGDNFVSSFTVSGDDQIQNMKIELRTNPLATCAITIDTIAIKPDRTFTVSQKTPNDDFQLDGIFTSDALVRSKLAISLCHGSGTSNDDGIVTHTFDWIGQASAH